MKWLLTILVWLLACHAQAQPVQRNAVTTNVLAIGTGMLTNNGAGVLGWMSLPAAASGTNQLISTNGTTVSASAGTVNWTTGVTGYVAGAITHLGVSVAGSSGWQPASENLTNWSNIPTGAMANVVATDFLTNWANSISNLTQTKQHGSANLTNWSNIPTGAMANVVATDFLTNWANSISNLTQTKQHGDAVLTNLVGTVAKNVTNENSTALEINSGTLTLSPGVLSNLNASTIDVPVANVISNVGNVKWLVQQPDITTSNLVVSFATNRYECVGITNLVMTNIIEEATGVSADCSIAVRAVNGNVAIVWPAYGAQHGYFFRTNSNNPILSWAAVTNAKTAVISLTAVGTNIFATITEWP